MEVFYAGNVEWRSQHFRDKKYQGSSIQLKEIFLEGCNESFSGKSGDTSSCLLL